MRVTVICTVLNEGESIRRLMDTLVAQTRRPDEVVIVDGGSRDDTVAVCRSMRGRLPLRVLVEPGANISRGRNVAIAPPRATSSPRPTPACGWSRGWLEQLVAPLARSAGDATEHAVRRRLLRRRPADAVRDGHGRHGAADRWQTWTRPRFLPSSRSVAFTQGGVGGRGRLPRVARLLRGSDLRPAGCARRQGRSPGRRRPWRTSGRAARCRRSSSSTTATPAATARPICGARRHAIRYVTYLVALPGLLALGIAALAPAGCWRCWPASLSTAGRPTAGCAAPGRSLALGRRALQAIALVPVIRAGRRRRQDARLSRRLGLAAAPLARAARPSHWRSRLTAPSFRPSLFCPRFVSV